MEILQDDDASRFVVSRSMVLRGELRFRSEQRGGRFGRHSTNLFNEKNTSLDSNFEIFSLTMQSVLNVESCSEGSLPHSQQLPVSFAILVLLSCILAFIEIADTSAVSFLSIAFVGIRNKVDHSAMFRNVN